jgi:glycosyltransferase involved in cell wall biosynthesis
MKILQYPAYITINGKKEFSRSTSGYGYMTLDIATSIASLGVEVDLLTQSNITKGEIYDGVNILSRTWVNIILNFKFSNLFSATLIILKKRISIKRIPKILLYYISMGYFIKVLKKCKYDLVHIHGISYYTLPIIEVCKKKKIKYIVTLHGLNSFSDSITGSIRDKEIEKIFLRDSETNNLPVTVISTGIRKTILEYLNIKNSKTFNVIPNGCNVDNIKNSFHVNIRQKYNIKEGGKIILCVGNICIRKNQNQIVDAFDLLSKDIQNTTTVLFLGNDLTDGDLEKKINQYSLKDKLIICGNIPKTDLPDYYSQANFNIVASLSEGFGLPIIEGFVFGLPCIAFTDIDAIEDLYDEIAMLLINERSDKAMATKITEMCLQDWDKSKIIKHGLNFSLHKMATQYLDYIKK